MPKNIHQLTISADTNAAIQPSVIIQTTNAPQIAINQPPAQSTTTNKNNLEASSALGANSLSRNDSRRLLDCKSQSVSSKPRPPPLPSLTSTSPSSTPNANINPTNNLTGENHHLSNQNLSSKPTIQQLSLKIQQLDISVNQKDKLEEFLKLRERLGDLTNDELSVEGELGSGNGGVVLKVRHRKTGIVMAKKVF